VPKKVYKIESFEGGINQKADPRDIKNNQLEEAFNVDVSNPGRIVMTGDGTSSYVNVNAKNKQVSPTEESSSLLLNGSNLTNGYGLFNFSHDYNMADTPSEVASDFICINDGAKVHIWDSCYDSAGGVDSWLNSKITLGKANSNNNGNEWIEKVKPIYYKADNGLRVCDGQFCSQNIDALLNADVGSSTNTFVLQQPLSSNIAANDYLKINNEIVKYISGTTTIKVLRGQFGTTASSHVAASSLQAINVPKILSHIKRPFLEKARKYTNLTDYTNASADIAINKWQEDVQALEPANNYSASGQPYGLVVYDGKVTGMATTGTSGTTADESLQEPNAPEKVLFSVHESKSADDNVQRIASVVDGGVLNSNNTTVLIHSNTSFNFAQNGFTVGKLVIVSGSTNYDGLAEIVGQGDAAHKIKISINHVSESTEDKDFDIRLEENRISEDLQNKYIFGMSFVYDGGGSEKQESPVKPGYVYSGLIPHDASIGKTNSGWKTDNAAQSSDAVLAIEDDDGAGYSTWILNDGTFFFDDSAISENKFLMYNGDSLADGTYKIAIDVAEAGQLKIYPPGNDADSSGGSVGDGTGDSATVTINTPGVYLFSAVKDTSNESATFNFVCEGIDGQGDIRINSVQVFNDTPVEMDANNAIDMRGFEGVPKMFSGFNMNRSSQYQWNDRIIGYRIYMKQVDSATTTLLDEWLLALDVNLQSGEYINYANEAAEQYLHLSQNWVEDSSSPVVDTFVYSSVCTEKVGGNTNGRSNMDTLRNIPLNTYESENGYKAETNTAAMYKTATIIDRKVFIGNLKIGEKTYPDRMIEAPVDRFDTFPDDGLNYIDIAVGDGDEIVKLESVGNKLIQFKKKHAYLIQVSSEGVDVLETWAHKGIKSAAQSILAGNGIVWVNDSGLYYYDGKDLKIITSDSFQSNTWIINEDPAKPPILGYDESSNKVIILTSNVTEKNNGGYIYDIQNASLTECQNLFNTYPITLENAMLDANGDGNYDILDIIYMHTQGSDTILQEYGGLILPGYIDGENIPIVPDEIYRSNMITTKDRQLLIATNTSTAPLDVGFTAWTNNERPLYNFNSAADSFLVQTKDIDFGNIARRKKIYSIYISFKAQSFMSGVIVKYATNGSNTFNGIFKNTTYYNNAKGFDAYNAGTSSNEWITVQLKPENSITNVYSIQLQFSFANAGNVGNLDAVDVAGDNTITLAATASGTVDNYNGMPIYFHHGRGHSYYGKITDYDESSKVATISPPLSKGVSKTTAYDIGFIPKQFAINDIAIVYREKSIK
tara:strand:+ start:219 stop:4067 length:3849 start_codon:yes stop_codon:yes gene_type:complete